MDGDPYHVGQDPELVRSPGGWTAPPGSKPGWDWLPRSGGTPDMIGMPRWLRGGIRRHSSIGGLTSTCGGTASGGSSHLIGMRPMTMALASANRFVRCRHPARVL